MTDTWQMKFIPMLIGGIGYAFIFNFDLKLGIGIFFILWAYDMREKIKK